MDLKENKNSLWTKGGLEAEVCINLMRAHRLQQRIKGRRRPQAAPQYQQYQQGPQAQPKQPGRKAERFNETKDAMVSGTRYRQISGGFFPLAQEIVVEKNPGYVKLSIVKAGISGIGQKGLLPAAE